MVKPQLNRDIKVVQVYPYNNPVTKLKTKSVVLAGLPYVTFSRYYDHILIISRSTSSPINENTVCIEAENKKDYYKNIVNFLSSMNSIPKVIEVHQDVSLAVFIAKKFKNKVHVSVIRHGPSLYRNFHDKIFFLRLIYEKFVLSKLTYVYCISEYTTNNFKLHYPKSANKFITIYNTYGHLKPEKVSSINERNNIVTFVGKPLKFKGIFIFLKAIVKFLKQKPDWQAMIIGAIFSNKSKYSKIINNINKEVELGNINKLLLFEGLPIYEVFNKMKQNKVVVIPCIVSEPFCLVALEAHIAGCVVVSSGRGALKEVSGDYAYYLNDLNPDSLFKVLLHIDKNPQEAEKMARLGNEYALKKFNPKELVIKLDNIRSRLINS